MPRTSATATPAATTKDIKPRPYDRVTPDPTSSSTSHLKSGPHLSSAPLSSPLSGSDIKSDLSAKSSDKRKTPTKAKASGNVKIDPDSPSKRGGTGRPWTREEKLLLFETVLKKGAGVKTFEGLIEGRTGKQCYDSWK